MMCQAVVFAVLALCLHQGYAIKCYSCNSATDPKCGDPIDSSLTASECTPDFFKEASGMLKSAADVANNFLGKVGIDSNLAPDADAHFVCMKAVKQDNDKKVVVRSCSVPKNDKFDMCAQLKAQGGVTFCETCDSDTCNTAAGVIPSALLMMCAAAALLMFKQ